MADKTFSKIVMNGETLIDLLSNTAESGQVLANYVSINSAGISFSGNITTKTTSDITVAGPTVAVPAGYYTSQTTKTVSSGTAGTPTASKGSVSNHSISVTPSVTNTSGYITGSTKTGTAVTVSASELVSGTLNITSSGTKDVTNYVSASIAAGSATTPATTITTNPSISINTSGKITASNSKTQNVTPTVTAGYVSSGTAGTITVSGSSELQLTTQAAATITPSGSSQTAVASQRYTTGAVTVAAVPTESATLTSNGTHTASSNKWWKSVTVQVPSDLNLQSNKNVIPSESQQTVNPDSGYNGLAQVTVAGISTDYVGSAITRRSSLNVADNVVTASAGYYAAATSATVSTATLPTTTSTTSAGTAKLTIDRSTSTRYINIPKGYVTASGYYTISPVANGAASGKTALSATSATLTTGTNTITLTKTSVDNTPSVTAGYVSAGTTTTATMSLTASVTTKAAATYSVTTADQEIAAGTYLTGKQTIKGVTGGKYTATSNQTGVNILNYSTLDVQVPSDLNLQSNKNATPSTSQVIVTPDTGYNGLQQVTVAAMTSGTAGTPTATKGTVSNNQISITPSVTNTTGYITGGTKSGTAVTVSASELVSGNYIITGSGNNQNVVNYAYVNVPSGSATTPATTINATTTATLSTTTGLVSVNVSGSSSITPSVSGGWVSSGTAGTVSVSGSSSIQLNTKAAATYTPGTANQTIAAGQYLVGAQTISGDADLVASNIKKDVNIFGVTGTYEGSGGSGAPVGTVICMNTNTNPSTDLGGTWELIDKEFASFHGTNSTLDGCTSSDFFTPYATNGFSLEESEYTSTTTPNYGCVVNRSGHTIQVTMRAKSSTLPLDEDGKYLGTFNLTPLGLSSIVDRIYLTGWSESGDGIIMLQVYHSGAGSTANRLLESDIVTKTANGTIPAGSECLITVIFHVTKDAMLDSACDKFYFKKTSDTDYTVKTGAKTITANGTYNPANDSLDYYSQVTVQRGTSEPGYLNINGELVATFTYDKWAVANEGLTVTTYSTATSTLKASAAAYGTYAADTANYNYTVVQEVLVYPVYTNSAPATAAGKFRGEMYHLVNDYCNYRSGFVVVDGTSSGAVTLTATASQYRVIYNTGATALTAGAVSNYGYYMMPAAATFGSTISVTRPSLLQRGSTTYCASAFVAAVSDVRYQWIAKIYRSPKEVRPTGGMVYSGMQHVADAFNSTSHTLT